jgi:hypothetical protein
MSSEEYLLDNARREAGARFGALAELFDTVTFRHIAALGIEPGWRCWEVGAGGPSVPAWLSDRVGRGGEVLATDLDPRWIDAHDGGGVTVGGTTWPATTLRGTGSISSMRGWCWCTCPTATRRCAG